jgi:hypothetical protein
MKSSIGCRALLIGVMILTPLTALAGLQGENLLVAPIPGWVQAYNAAGNGIRLLEYVPPGQNINAWSQMATLEIFYGRGGTKPGDLQQKIVQGFRENCDGLHVSDLGSGTSGGLPAARWLTYCSKFRPLGTGEISYSQAISGKDHFYLVQRSWRGAPFDLTKPLPIPDTLLKEWEAYLNQVSVCDSRDPKRLCP